MNTKIDDKSNDKFLGKFIYLVLDWAKKKSNYLYYIFYSGIILISFIVGLFIGTGISNYPYIEHIGIGGLSNFDYTNLNNFRSNFYPNSVISDQILKVSNDYDKELTATTQIEIIPTGDISIECYVMGEEKNCQDYQIKPNNIPTILQFNISIGHPKEEKYKICFHTFQTDYKSNGHYDCKEDVVIFPSK